MNNKVGILTFHRTTNFGSCLQTYGLYRKILDLGYPCEIIDYRCSVLEKREKLSLSLWDRNLKRTVKNWMFYRGYKEKAKSLAKFLNENMQLSIPYFKDSLSDVEECYEKIVVGSDVVWGRDITEGDYSYFLDFVHEPKKKFAFASSVGDYSVRGDESKVAGLLNEFAKVAVREEDAVKWIESIGGPEADWVCDPTMLLTATEWEKYVPPVEYFEDYVLVYFKDSKDKSINDAIAYAKKNNCKVYYINYEVKRRGVCNIKPKSLNEFLGLIKHAKMVFTASYHGMLFSIYFHKEFLFYTRARKSRVHSLAGRLGLEHNCGDDADIYNYIPVKYSDVEQKLQTFRNNSIDILRGMLEKNS